MHAGEIQRIAVLGAGTMGSGLAQKYAMEGFPVLLMDIDQTSLERGMNRIRETLDEAVQRRIVSQAQASSVLDRIRPEPAYPGDLRHVDLVIEAIYEDLETKRSACRRLEEATRPDAILATNTSSFYVKQLAEVVSRPERVLGLHYFYHPAKNRLVEVVPGPSTAPELMERVWSLQERIGKTPIASADAPGFVVNRFFVPWINEAARMLGENAATIPTIEEAAKESFAIGMGPFELMNLTGIAIGFHAAANLARELGPFYAPAPVIRSMMEENKTFDLSGNADPARFTEIRERLQGVVFHVAAQLVSERVGTLEDVDIGARVGLRWGRGPFEMMNRLGLSEANRLSHAVEDRYGLPTPILLHDQVRLGAPFPLRLVRSEMTDGIATLTFNRPDALNALNPEAVAQFSVLLEEALADPSVRGIVIAGAGKAFVAGADIRFFVRNIEEGRFSRIVDFAEQGQRLLRRIETCPVPVIARLDGLALGGGAELALACDQIVATEKGSLGFPETGIGIYPGLGGTQRTSRRIGIPLTRWLVLTGQTVDAALGKRLGLIDRVVPHQELRMAIEQAVAQGKTSAARQGPARSDVPEAVTADPRLALAHRFFEAKRIDYFGSGEPAPEFADIARKIRRKAPLAVTVADELILQGGKKSLEEGLRLEMSRMDEIFRTRDALEGLSTLGRSAPEFIGE